MALLLGFRCEFPTQRNRELFSRNREFYRKNREFHLPKLKSMPDEVFDTHSLLRLAINHKKLSFTAQTGQAPVCSRRVARTRGDIGRDMGAMMRKWCVAVSYTHLRAHETVL